MRWSQELGGKDQKQEDDEQNRSLLFENIMTEKQCLSTPKEVMMLVLVKMISAVLNDRVDMDDGDL